MRSPEAEGERQEPHGHQDGLGLSGEVLVRRACPLPSAFITQMSLWPTCSRPVFTWGKGSRLAASGWSGRRNPWRKEEDSCPCPRSRNSRKGFVRAVPVTRASTPYPVPATLRLQTVCRLPAIGTRGEVSMGNCGQESTQFCTGTAPVSLNRIGYSGRSASGTPVDVDRTG
jgi:hypothetical protein